MKSKLDPRHLKRIKIIRSLFAWDFGNDQPSTPDSKDITKNLPQIDEIVQKNAPKWPIDKINKIDLAILRYAFWELIFNKKTPFKVIIDEAIELAKEFGTESSPSFINGVIGSAIKNKDVQQ